MPPKVRNHSGLFSKQWTSNRSSNERHQSALPTTSHSANKYLLCSALCQALRRTPKKPGAWAFAKRANHLIGEVSLTNPDSHMAHLRVISTCPILKSSILQTVPPLFPIIQQYLKPWGAEPAQSLNSNANPFLSLILRACFSGQTFCATGAGWDLSSSFLTNGTFSDPEEEFQTCKKPLVGKLSGEILNRSILLLKKILNPQ